VYGLGMKIRKNINVKIAEKTYRRIKHHQRLCKMLNHPARMNDVVEQILVIGLQTLSDMENSLSRDESTGNQSGSGGNAEPLGPGIIRRRK